MENLSVTQQIINYCRSNPNSLFDVELMFGNVFQCGDFNSFRKYVSRAKEPGAYMKSAKVFTILERILPRKIFKSNGGFLC